MTKVIMHGCNGKMGQVITGLIAQDEDVEIVAGIDTYDEKKNDYPVYKSIRECQIAADVVIDFSNAKAVDELWREETSAGTLHHRFIRRPAGESY